MGKTLKVILLAMIIFDFSLHLAEILAMTERYPLYNFFTDTILTFIGYDLFWTTFWGIGFVLALIILIDN